MMTQIVFSFFIILLTTPLCLAKNEQILYKDKSKQQRAKYMSIEKRRISETKTCIEKKCKAYDFINNKGPFPEKIPWMSGGVNPTFILCDLVNGTPKIGYLQNNDEVSLCYFNDGSFIFGWDLMDIFNEQSTKH